MEKKLIILSKLIQNLKMKLLRLIHQNKYKKLKRKFRVRKKLKIHR